MSVTQLGYIGIEASDLAAWASFGSDVLGLQIVHQDAQRLVFRMDDHEQRITIVAGPADDLAFSGWETASEADLEATVARLRAAGYAVSDGGAALAAERRVEKLYCCADPDSNRVELYFGPAVTAAPFRSPELLSGFVTGVQGLGHYFLVAKRDRQTTLDFYVGLLGFRISDYIREEIAPGIVADAAFLHCNGRHHTLAAAVMPVPKHIHHLLLEVSDMADVGRAYDRVNARGLPVEMTLGMHPNDRMFSFYVISPSGFSIEFGWGGLVVDDATWSVKSFDRLSEWGHKRPAPLSLPA